MKLRRLLVLTLVLAIALPLFAQHEGHDMIGWVPTEILERPTTLKPGVGKISDPVTTISPEAQAFYNQGVAYLHSYVWIEAARSFHQALRLDANLAMAELGLYRTYLNLDDLTQARAALKRAQSLEAHASPREVARIEAMTKHLAAISDTSNKSLHLEYRVALEKALAAFPDDAELWLLRGNAEEAGPRGRGQRGGIGSIAYYEAALKRAPDHWGANHYLIHSYEFIGRIDEALKHGLIYADAAPAIPHAHHMYGHDLRRAGRTDEAIERFRKADALEQAYYKDENIPATYDWHHVHNLNLLATAYQYQGKLKTTEDLLHEAMNVPVISDYQEFSHKDYPEFLLNRRRYADALAAARKLTASKSAMTSAAGHSLAGNALFGLNPKDIAGAQAELNAAEADLKKMTSDTDSVQPYIDSLHAEILLRSGKQSEANDIFKDVQKRVRAIPGPDAWMQAIYRLELIARIAREASDWELAEYSAKQMLDHDAFYGGSQFAMALVAEHKGDGFAAKEMLMKARTAWSKADAGFQELAEIEKHIERAGDPARPAASPATTLVAAPTVFQAPKLVTMSANNFPIGAMS